MWLHRAAPAAFLRRELYSRVSAEQTNSFLDRLYSIKAVYSLTLTGLTNGNDIQIEELQACTNRLVYSILAISDVQEQWHIGDLFLLAR